MDIKHEVAAPDMQPVAPHALQIPLLDPAHFDNALLLAAFNFVSLHI